MREDAKANPAGYAARKVSQYATSKAAGGSARSCTYCRESGHNRKSCNKLIVDYAKAITKNAEYRKNILQHMTRCGIGVGALISVRYNDTPVCLITEIVWDAINDNGTFSSAGSIKVDGDSYTKYHIALDKFDIVSNTYKDYYWNLESGTSPEMVKDQVPNDWLSGKSPAIDDYFGFKR
jgi:hypothetical protein